jgi:hypothetical protein
LRNVKIFLRMPAMAQKNYRPHFVADVRLVATKIREMAMRVDDIANRMEASGYSGVDLLDRLTLDKSLLKVAEWVGKAAIEIDALDVKAMSENAGIASASKRTAALHAVAQAAEKRLQPPLAAPIADSSADVETAREQTKKRSRTPAKRSD